MENEPLDAISQKISLESGGIDLKKFSRKCGINNVHYNHIVQHEGVCVKKNIICIPLLLFISVGAIMKPTLDQTYSHIPLSFTLNESVAFSIRFTAQGSGCRDGILTPRRPFSSPVRPASVSRRARKRSILYQGNPAERDDIETESFALGLEFVGANKNPNISGEDRLPWNNNYFIGNDPSKWRSDVPNYRKIRFSEVYRGIDLVYYGNQKRVKYDFVVKPGEDPKQILLKYDFGQLKLSP